MTKPTAQHTISDLLYLMARLRDPATGCPWDCKQNHQSLAPYVLEEAYEVADAIERGDGIHLPEELGDLLFQVVFHAQLGSEKGEFDFAQIVATLVTKLIARHPHVFPEGVLTSTRNNQPAPEEQAISAVWEEKKRTEREGKGYSHWLADIPKAFPALLRAQKIQKRAAKAGFDWPDIAGVFAKVREEINELEAEVAAQNPVAMVDEIGDLFFSLVNVARHLGIDSETALRQATTKFERRFGAMEDLISVQGKAIDSLALEELDRLWMLVKVQESGRL